MRRRYRNWLIIALVVNLTVLSIYGYHYFRDKLPGEIRILTGEEERISFSGPYIAKMEGERVGVLEVNRKPLPEGSITIDFSEPVTLLAKEQGNATIELKLFGIFPFKKIEVAALTKQSVIVGGSAIGLKLETNGILVLGTAPILGEDKNMHRPAENKLKTGDYIVGVYDKKLTKKEELISVVEQSEGKEIIFTVRRNDKETKIMVKPVKGLDGGYKLGVWVRDDTQGIGTMTYVTQDGKFGALGHGITDVDTGILFHVGSGSAYPAKILRVVKGEPGNPGELCGVIEDREEDQIGIVQKNTEQGIFGTVLPSCSYSKGKQIAEIALKRDVKKGPAVILCEMDGEIRQYDIEIEKINIQGSNRTKEIVIRITDEELLSKTGGIVQGMSGSPILQEGKLIGAVTHVFVNNPEKGYGIFIEEMLAQ